jgi:glycosyltransferase involved in cell wall biosynthesis
VEFKSWSESIVGKAKAHILYDQIRDGYGLSAIEAAAMGIPVLGGYMQQTSRDVAVPLMGGEYPFVETSESNIGEKMLALATDTRYYMESAGRGEAFARSYHDERVTVKRLKDIWTRARDEYQPDDEPW